MKEFALFGAGVSAFERTPLPADTSRCLQGYAVAMTVCAGDCESQVKGQAHAAVSALSAPREGTGLLLEMYAMYLCSSHCSAYRLGSKPEPERCTLSVTTCGIDACLLKALCLNSLVAICGLRTAGASVVSDAVQAPYVSWLGMHGGHAPLARNGLDTFSLHRCVVLRSHMLSGHGRYANTVAGNRTGDMHTHLFRMGCFATSNVLHRWLASHAMPISKTPFTALATHSSASAPNAPALWTISESSCRYFSMVFVCSFESRYTIVTCVLLSGFSLEYSPGSNL